MLKPKISRSLVINLGHKPWQKYHHEFLTMNSPIVHVNTLGSLRIFRLIWMWFFGIYFSDYFSNIHHWNSNLHINLSGIQSLCLSYHLWLSVLGIPHTPVEKLYSLKVNNILFVNINIRKIMMWSKTITQTQYQQARPFPSLSYIWIPSFPHLRIKTFLKTSPWVM